MCNSRTEAYFSNFTEKYRLKNDSRNSRTEAYFSNFTEKDHLDEDEKLVDSQMVLINK
jgi:hypothetical protein